MQGWDPLGEIHEDMERKEGRGTETRGKTRMNKTSTPTVYSMSDP